MVVRQTRNWWFPFPVRVAVSLPSKGEFLLSRTFRSLSPLYDFNDGDHVTFPIPPAVKPLPPNLLSRNLWDIPAAGRLADLQSDLDSAAAFERWAQELLGLYEYAWSRPTVPDLEAKIAAVDAAWAQPRPEATTPEAHADRLVRRAALAPFYNAGLTLGEIAAVTALSLREVVRTVMSAKAVPNAERYAALEIELLNGALDRRSYRDLQREFGANNVLVAAMCDRLGVDRSVAAARSRVSVRQHNVAA